MLYYRLTQRNKHYRLFSGIFEACGMFIAALVAVVFIITLFFRVVEVQGESMYPTLHDRDIAVSVFPVWPPKPGDIIVFRKNRFEGDVLVKRVIATGGQTVYIGFDTGDVYVDDVKLSEPYITGKTRLRESVSFPRTVPEGCYFVMGDNRENSLDSRSPQVGMVDRRLILGRYMFGINNIREALR